VHADGMGCPGLSFSRKRLNIRNNRHLITVEPEFVTNNNNRKISKTQQYFKYACETKLCLPPLWSVQAEPSPSPKKYVK
jgi:hypothetical protein